MPAYTLTVTFEACCIDKAVDMSIAMGHLLGDGRVVSPAGMPSFQATEFLFAPVDRTYREGGLAKKPCIHTKEAK